MPHMQHPGLRIVVPAGAANGKEAAKLDASRSQPDFERRVSINVDITSLPGQAGTLKPSSLAQFEALLVSLGEQESFVAMLDFSCSRSVGITISADIQVEGAGEVKNRPRIVSRLLEAAVGAALPGMQTAGLRMPAKNGRNFPCRTVIRPSGLVLPVGDSRMPRQVAGRAFKGRAVTRGKNDAIVFSPPVDANALLGLGRAIAAIGAPVIVELTLRPTELRDGALEEISDASWKIADRRYADTVHLVSDQRLTEASQRLQMLVCEGKGVLLEVAVRSPAPLSKIELSSLSATLFGRAHDPDQAGHCANLRHLYPQGMGIGCFLAIIAAAIPPCFERRSLARLAKVDGLVIGRTLAGTKVRMPVTQPRSHVYIAGRSGTGKSTMVQNMALQDAEEGKGVILFDPHGDLWRDIQRRLPASRRGDLEVWHVADPAMRPGINMLQLGPGDPGEQRNRVVNDLNRIIRRQIYTADTREAFGPLFDQHFRAGMMLLLEGEGEQASIYDFDRVYRDEKYRHALMRRPGITDTTKLEWEAIHDITYDDHRINNMGPWVTSKLTQLTKSSLMRPILDVKRSTLDFDAALNDRNVVLVNLAASAIGAEAVALIGGIMSFQLTNAGIRQGLVPEEKRTDTAVYLDEFQTYASEVLASMMSETRKFGLRITLANQTLSQLSGRGHRPDVVQEVLGNASNLIIFGVDTADAAYLAPRFGGLVSAEQLSFQPNFHAYCLVQTADCVLGPLLIRSLPARKAP